MADDTELKTTITQQASAPSNETVDGQSVTERPLTELIEADRHVTGGSALKKRTLGLIFRKITPGSALG